MTSNSGSDRFRPEIQALRAVATVIGVGFHLWPNILPGGFYGNEVFFVLSGFLITGLILREIDRTGNVSLASFWARRARRLLPAALFVLLATTAATLIFLPKDQWLKGMREIGACSVYLQNRRLAADEIDYWATGQAPSLVQHFWSLSVEEQFYLLCPVLLALAAGAAALFRVGRDRLVRGLLAGATGASLIYWLIATRENSITAYYSTAAHAWQFSAGGLLAATVGSTLAPSRISSIVSWAGLLLIAVSAVAFTSNASFFGLSALIPTLGTLAVIGSGTPQTRWSPAGFLRLPPIQYLGEISYAVCLWHWPLIVALPRALGRPLDLRLKLAIAALSVLAAWLTKLAIEDPFRYGSWLRARRPAVSFGLAGVGMAALLLTTQAVVRSMRADDFRNEERARRLLSLNIPCFGAASRAPAGPPCLNAKLDAMVVPADLKFNFRESGDFFGLREPSQGLDVVEFGAPAGSASAVFALVGDSTANRARTAFETIAAENNWRGFSLVGCAATQRPETSDCAPWNGLLLAWLARHPEVETVFMTAFHASPPDEAAVDGVLREWASMPDSVRHIVVLRANPANLQPDCVANAVEHGLKPAKACSDARAEALAPDPAVEAAQRLRSPRVRIVDLTDFYCDAARCRHVIGGVRLYIDSHHLTRTYWQTLAPYLAARIGALAPPKSGRARL